MTVKSVKGSKTVAKKTTAKAVKPVAKAKATSARSSAGRAKSAPTVTRTSQKSTVADLVGSGPTRGPVRAAVQAVNQTQQAVRPAPRRVAVEPQVPPPMQSRPPERRVQDVQRRVYGGNRMGMNVNQGGNGRSQNDSKAAYGAREFSHLNGGRFSGVVDDKMIPDAGMPTDTVSGVLDTNVEGHGLLRPKFIPSNDDVYISTSQIRRFGLRPGDMVTGPARKPKENERYWGLLKVDKVNGKRPVDLNKRPRFGDLTAIFPDEKLAIETDKEPLSSRLIDLVSPVGRGQRGMIVSPPKAGKTTIMKDMATGIAKNYPKIHLMAVLIGERPEEVTDIRKHIEKVTDGSGEVIASNFDERAENQTRAAEIALERAKRLVESGGDVFILLDSVTRLARAYNLAIPTSGRTLSGGFDPAALYPPKRFFGAARNFEEGGSLTIIGTALVDTGSRMDDLVYEEFKGTGNMELHLSRRLAEKRIFPAIDVQRSGTRKEELLFTNSEYQSVVMMRRMLDVLNDDERTTLLLEKMKKTKNNKEFLASLKEG